MSRQTGVTTALDLDGTGDCFPAALQFLLERELAGEPLDDYRVCHGTVVGGPGPHWHAWVEQTLPLPPAAFGVWTPEQQIALMPALIVCIDRSNGNDATLPEAMYYKLGQVSNVTRYTYIEAARLAVEHGHYGPWPAD